MVRYVDAVCLLVEYWTHSLTEVLFVQCSQVPPQNSSLVLST